MTTAAARELVGQPFLRDHVTCAPLNKKVGGPVHLIACQKGVTESQALRQLGFPDAVVLSAPFGVYVADYVQKVQMERLAVGVNTPQGGVPELSRFVTPRFRSEQ